MLLKAKLGDVQKFVRITELDLTVFLSAAFAKFGVPPVMEGVKVFDSSGTEVDEDVFEDIVNDPSTGVLTIKYDTESVSSVASEYSQPSSLNSSLNSDSQETVIISDSPSRKRQRLDAEAKQLVESILSKKPGGERIVNEYNQTKSLTDETRRKMVNMLAAEMTERNGPKKSELHQFFIVLDQNTIPCRTTSSLGAFDELFKAHFVFGSTVMLMGNMGRAAVLQDSSRPGDYGSGELYRPAFLWTSLTILRLSGSLWCLLWTNPVRTELQEEASVATTGVALAY
ncbi:uncharacterized protein LOC143099948 [Alosa pseudoharengus]|uniref:uncharacterized protein LOC143099948 n=1 Tax=Alosa pseudoharengus TaxID=34774 RepID=UPI003F89CC49